LFTPNGDGINDFWQFILPPSGVNPIRELYIFDRYGRLLAQVDPQSAGWDGTFNGQPVPASDYWFRAVNNNNQEVRGHFSLKR
jgi:gliding motility-associated-like protein